MGLIVCPDCERELGETAKLCPHCGAVIDEQARQHGVWRRQQTIIHGSIAVGLCVAGCLLGAVLHHWFAWSEIAIGIGGICGFVIGSVLGYFLAQRAAS